MYFTSTYLGVPIPIFYCEDGTPIIEQEVFDHISELFREHGSNVWFERDEKDLLPEGYTNEHSPNGIFKRKKISWMYGLTQEVHIQV